MDTLLPATYKIFRDVFEFLLNKHLEEKKKGKEFNYILHRPHIELSDTPVADSVLNVIVSFWNTQKISIILSLGSDGNIILFMSGEENVLSEFTNGLEIENLVGIKEIARGEYGLIKYYTNIHNGEYLYHLQHFLETDKRTLDRYNDTFDEVQFVKKELQLSSNLRLRPIDTILFYFALTKNIEYLYKTQDYYFDEMPTGIQEEKTWMPIAIKSIEVRNYRGIHHLKIDGIPVNTKWILLTGDNGYGKTSVLQSIALGLHGDTDGSLRLLDDDSLIVLEGKNNGKDYLNISFNAGTHREFTSMASKMAVYGANRLQTTSENTGPGAGSVLYNLFFANGSLANIETELKESYAYNKEKFQLLKDAFCELIPDLADITIEVISGKPVVKYLEKEANEAVIFDHLAAGFRNIIAVVGDIITRLNPFTDSEQPQKGNDRTTSTGAGSNKLSQITGVVIIDELELHLHPNYQKRFPQILTQLFPNVLFIASTHSPIPLLGMPPETVLLKVNRNKEEAITVERLDVDFANLLPNAILTSPIFGFNDLVPDSNDSNKMIALADTYAEVKGDEEKEKTIDNFLTDDKTQELLNLLKK